jgi:hypothetical protein
MRYAPTRGALDRATVDLAFTAIAIQGAEFVVLESNLYRSACWHGMESPRMFPCIL